MKRNILLVCLLISSHMFAQKWEMREMGNAFDGFAKMSAVNADNSTPAGVLLGVVNEAKTIDLVQGIGEDGTFTNLYIRLLFNEDFIDVNSNIERVLMSFDNERVVYEIRKFNVSKSAPFVELEYAFLNGYNECFNKIDIINLFKSKSKVHFRIFHDDEFDDMSFSLEGSKEAINKVYKINGYVRYGDWRDFRLEAIHQARPFSIANDGKDNITFSYINCVNFFKATKGEYFFILIDKVKYFSEESGSYLTFYDNRSVEIAKIDDDIAFLNMLYFSGYPKILRNGRYQRDEETIQIYFDVLVQFNVIDSARITLSDFKKMERHELSEIYKLIVGNQVLFDLFRINQETFTNYSIQDYKFEVFIEPWG